MGTQVPSSSLIKFIEASEEGYNHTKKGRKVQILWENYYSKTLFCIVKTIQRKMKGKY